MDYENLTNIARREAQRYVGLATAEDIAQDVLVAAIEAKHDANLEAFVREGAKLKALTFCRNESRRREIEAENVDHIKANILGAREELAADPLDLLIAGEVGASFEDLSPLLQRTVTEYYIEGQTTTEIAESHGATEGAIRERLRQAREIIRG